MKYLFIIFAITLLGIETVSHGFLNQQDVDKPKDSIDQWIKSSRNRGLPDINRKYFLDKAFENALLIKEDTLRNKYLSEISLEYFRINDSLSFRSTNKLSAQLSSKIGDSATLAYSYWDLGDFYSDYELKDSAYFNYYQAQKIYENINDGFRSARMLLRMAIMQTDSRDYTGSEVTTIKAIELLKPLKEYKYLYSAYNNLGIIFNELQEHDKAIFYHNKALEFQNYIKDDNTLRSSTLNNIGVVYEMHEKYDRAIEYYQRALDDKSLKEADAQLYAMLLDNLAYSKFRSNDTVGIKTLFEESLQLRDSIDDVSGKTINKLHLAEYYATYNDSIKALQLAIEAKELAEDSRTYRDLLAALLLLSKLDKEKSNQYSQRYIALSDKLLKEERAIRNKFARIRFETDEFIERNELLSEQKKRILTIGSAILILGILLYIIRNQRLKNVRLRLEKEQQMANEEIYNLMLTQQYKLDEGKRNEKKRMSEELHDGVLGNLYGIRMNLGILNHQNDPEAILKREAYIESLSGIIDEIRNVSHELHTDAIDSGVGYNQLIEELLEKHSKTNDYGYEFLTDCDVSWQEVRGDIKMNIYRIIQEAVQNVNKYAKAKHLEVILKSDGNNLRLLISDDGIGFDTKSVKDGIGIKNIKSRVERLKGEVEFISEHKKGASIIIRIPYQNT